MTQPQIPSLPEALRALADIPIEADGVGLRFLPDFLPTAWMDAWFAELRPRAGIAAQDFLAFALTGEEEEECVTFWLARPGVRIEEQPVVALGPWSMPELLASDLAGFLWGIADVLSPDGIDASLETDSNHDLVRVARRFAPTGRRTWTEAQTAARAEFPDFLDHFARWAPARQP
ncbi:hypothetical protein [Streptacidiphilus rugosus]|uniref:hypothetical protein n=1 Tax=Streptacidiphilus rugosus TaxID=405783 RepID=UPI00068BADF5|nr:hypothetical protein [Streptacidiphilus rugosus]